MTAQEYIDALRRLEAKNPAEALLADLRKGYSVIRAVYMRAALKRLPNAAPAQPEPVTKEAMPADDTMRRLWAERRSVSALMRKTSNEFHDCNSDAERSGVSGRLQILIQQRNRLREQINFYEVNRTLPETETENEKTRLPDDPVALMRKINSLRSIISQNKAKLRDLALLPDDHPEKAERIAEAEDILAGNKLYLKHAETKSAAQVGDIHS